MDSSLFDRFLDEKNFILAYKRVAAKGSRGGIDRVSVEDFGRYLKRNIDRLQHQIRENSYMPQAVESVHSPKFNEANEWRELGLPAVADKVVQTAMLYVVEPLAEKLFLDTSYGYRPGRGPYKAIRRVEHNLGNRKLQWVVRQDIDNFFDSLDHDRLLSLFSDLVHGDKHLVELVALWCRMGIVKKDGRWKNVEAGVRQGQVISPLLANLYLHSLDDFVADKGWGWVRYADDYILQCTEKAKVEEADREVTGFLKNTLGLRLNQNDNPISNLDHGFVFLGIYFKKDTREISQVKLKKIDRKIEWILSEKNRSEPEKVIGQLTQTVDGWRRYYSFIKPENKFSDLDRKIEKRLSKMLRTRVNAGAWPKKPPDEVDFEGRKRRGARDLVNSLPNYGYGILYSQTLNAVIMAGLNSTAGFLHSYQSGKPVLVYDLVEEFRATVVDRAIFSMLNRREILEQEENGLLKKDTRKKIAGAVLSRLGGETSFRGKRLTLEEVLKTQALAIKRHLQGKETYRPYLAKW